MNEEPENQYADCPRCEHDEHDYVIVQCESCRKSVDAIIDHLIAARVERSNLPRGQA
jgi:hypothetical protein